MPLRKNVYSRLFKCDALQQQLPISDGKNERCCIQWSNSCNLTVSLLLTPLFLTVKGLYKNPCSIDLLGRQDQFFSSIEFSWIIVLSAQILANLSRRKFRLAHVAKISSHMNGFTQKKGRLNILSTHLIIFHEEPTHQHSV